MRIAADEQQSRIDADLLIPGRGDPIRLATLVYSGKTITWMGATLEAPAKYRNLKVTQRVKILMPGLWDCHVHFWGTTKYSMDEMATTHPAVLGLRIARDAAATLNAGFTSVREMSGFGPQVAQVVREGWLPGPRVYSAVSILSPTGGHGDARSIPLREYWDCIAHSLPAYMCDGEAECLKGVRNQVRQGAEVIKVAASGGVSSTGDDISAQSFSDKELTAIVDEASRNNLIVAAHCHGAAGIKAALRAGCRTIEHGTYLDTDPEALQMMADKNRDVILVATRSSQEILLHYPDAWTPEQLEQLRENQKHSANSYRQAVASGVRIALGTDIAVSTGKLPWNHGMNGIELYYAVEAGMSPLQAIEAATANAPNTLGPKAPKSGQLKEGYDADFIALSKNPIEDIKVLADARNVTHVWRQGKQYKEDGRPIGFLL